MRNTLSNLLVSMGENNKKFIVLTGDHGYGLFDKFQKKFPNQFINAGVAEQNMIGLAAGLAKGGFLPVVYGLSSFVPIRVLEQIKIDIAYENLPVIIIGDGAGVVYSYLGTTHQCFDDIACTRSIPNLSIYSPADKQELTYCFNLAYQSQTPSYIRIGKDELGDIHKSELNSLRFNRGLISIKHLTESKYAFIATGSMVIKALTLLDLFSDLNIDLWSVPAIKPINQKKLELICKKYQKIVVFEEHSKYGGLYSIVSETASKFAKSKVFSIAIDDKFSESCGSYDFLLKEHGIDIDSILTKTSNFFEE